MPLDGNTIEQLPKVEGEVFYLVKMAEKPHSYSYNPPVGVPRTNMVLEGHRLPMHDMRPVADTISLDREGFALLTSPSAVRDFYDEEELRRVYYREAEQAIQAATGAARVVVFDHTIRRRTWDEADRAPQDRAPSASRLPVTRIHGDYTEVSGPQRVRDIMGDEAEDLLGHRFAIVNLWRPIRGPLRDAPLALCDAATLSDGDLVTHDLIYEDRTGEIFALTHNPAHRWFYAPEMRTDEILLLKCFDSARDGRARFMPHTSFQDPTAGQDVLPRESIELRTLVFFAD